MLFDYGKSKNRKRKNQTECDRKDTFFNITNKTSPSFVIERPSKKSRIEFKSSSSSINHNKTMQGTPNKTTRRITLGPAQLGPSIDLYLSNSAKKKQQEAEAEGNLRKKVYKVKKYVKKN